jgi:hypothetical protein
MLRSLPGQYDRFMTCQKNLGNSHSSMFYAPLPYEKAELVTNLRSNVTRPGTNCDKRCRHL